ncbi:MAG: VWA domain-containing protein [Myxococcales bacterium]|nr:VWA domain-containing protein [Myxococcales bacterium]
MRAPSALSDFAFILDGSSSMEGSQRFSLAYTVLGEAFDILGEPANLDAFRISLITFSDHPTAVFERVPCSRIEHGRIPSTPQGGGTNIALALDKARVILARPSADETPSARPLGLLLTDGEHNGAESVDEAATRFKAQGDLVAVGFGDASLAELGRIATSPNHAVLARSGEDLRRFFVRLAKSVSASVRAGLPAGDNITNALLRG